MQGQIAYAYEKERLFRCFTFFFKPLESSDVPMQLNEKSIPSLYSSRKIKENVCGMYLSSLSFLLASEIAQGNLHHQIFTGGSSKRLYKETS